jgi:hypothetical protein
MVPVVTGHVDPDALAQLTDAFMGTLRLSPDGTTTATSPDGRRVWHSHGPPGQAA